MHLKASPNKKHRHRWGRKRCNCFLPFPPKSLRKKKNKKKIQFVVELYHSLKLFLLTITGIPPILACRQLKSACSPASKSGSKGLRFSPALCHKWMATKRFLMSCPTRTLDSTDRKGPHLPLRFSHFSTGNRVYQQRANVVFFFSWGENGYRCNCVTSKGSNHNGFALRLLSRPQL